MTDLATSNAENGEAVPEGWAFVEISKLISEFRGGAPLKPSDFVKSGTMVLPKGAVGRGGWLRIDDSVQYCTNSYASAHQNNQVDETFTIVVLRDLVPSGPSIGLMVEIEKSSDFVLAQGVYGFKLNSKAVPSYLTQLSNTRWYRQLMNSIMVGSTQVHVTNTAFKLAKIPLPPPHEQRAIATALADADALIVALEGMIAKKRDLKQAAMQHLLTGKTRLPGFSGEWVSTSIGDIADVKTGPFGAQLHESDYVRIGTPIITVEHLGEFGIEVDDTVPLVSDFDKARLKAYQLQAGDIVFSRVGSIDRNALVREREVGWLFSGRLLRVRPQTEFHSGFLSYLFHSAPFKDRVLAVAVGQTMASLNTKILKGIRIDLPSLFQEQTAIAEVLSDMDTNLAALEAQAAKARAVKQGMMHELLTGRIRLI